MTVRGAGLGADGSVTFGGVAAHVVAWSAEELEVEVPAGAPAGWQELVVAPAVDGQASAGFFVGVAFDGEPEDVGAFLGDLEPGTHALLPPGELSLPGLELVVDGVHLHGHPDGTLLQLGVGRLSGGWVRCFRGGNSPSGNSERSSAGSAAGKSPSSTGSCSMRSNIWRTVRPSGKDTE